MHTFPGRGLELPRRLERDILPASSEVPTFSTAVVPKPVGRDIVSLVLGSVWRKEVRTFLVWLLCYASCFAALY